MVEETYMEKKKRKPLKIILIVVSSLLGAVIAFVGGFLIFASATALKVQDHEVMTVSGTSSKTLNKGQEIKILTWNIGYGALDEKQDFYYDGGKNVVGESKDKVLENLTAMENKISEINPDAFLVQEIDIKSKRSYRVNELEHFTAKFPEASYQHSYACNYKAGFVPIPLYQPMGRVEAGISTFTKFSVSEASREQLPIPFSWPMSLMNLKRCLLANRIPLANSDKSLVLVNLHLEAYDDGEGKAKQLAQLMGLLQSEYEAGNYVIAGGDFNQTFSEDYLVKYPKKNDWVCPVIDVEDYPDFHFLMDDTHPTCRSLYKPYYNSDKATHQFYMIDGFIVSDNVTISGGNVETIDLDFKTTDHNPVLLKAVLN